MPQRPLQLGGAAYHRGVVLSGADEHGQAVVLDAATCDILRVAAEELLAAYTSDLQPWQAPALIQDVAQHLGRWGSVISTPLRKNKKKKCGFAKHQVLAAWLHDAGVRHCKGYSPPSIADSISLQQIMQHLGVASVDLTRLPTDEMAAEIESRMAKRRAYKAAKSCHQQAGLGAPAAEQDAPGQASAKKVGDSFCRSWSAAARANSAGQGRTRPAGPALPKPAGPAIPDFEILASLYGLAPGLGQDDAAAAAAAAAAADRSSSGGGSALQGSGVSSPVEEAAAEDMEWE
ncbi:hypothetical protein COO60DRAFT_1647886 [Scenedesmus sp. NREL 46B-D3]|nr:hypothetical protein COO60DRAFT_1647886 [Scenedesmus sp. NREL 46B-D3]